MKCPKAQSKDDILSANGQSLPCKRLPVSAETGDKQTTKNVSQKTKAKREEFVQVSLPRSQLTPDLNASPLHLNMCTLEEEGDEL